MFNNYFKTTMLLAGLTSLLGVVGYFLGGSSGIVMFLGFGIIMNFVSYWFSSNIALAMNGAKKVSKSDFPSLYTDVEELSGKMGIPVPKVYVSNQPQPNAFATGRSPKSSAVCFTKGLLDHLNREEVKGVVAHELAHIKNYDILTSTIAAMIAGVISSMANVFMFSNMFGGNSENRNGGILGMLVVMILAPLSATLIQFAISRTREYSADATAAKYVGSPDGLMSALEKIEGFARQIPMDVNPAFSSLYIQNPLSKGAFVQLFSTHPPTSKRIAELSKFR